MPLVSGFGDQFETQNSILGQEHVLLENIHRLDTLSFVNRRSRVIAMKVLLKRSPHDGAEPVGRECSWQHTDISKRTFQRFVEDVADLVLEILGCNQRVDQVPPSLAQHGMDFTASSTQVFVVIEGLPKRKEGPWPRLSPRIKEDANFRIEDAPKSVEQPSVRIDFLAVLLFEAKYHLHRRQRDPGRIIVIGPNEFLIGCDGKLSGVLEL